MGTLDTFVDIRLNPHGCVVLVLFELQAKYEQDTNSHLIGRHPEHEYYLGYEEMECILLSRRL